MSAVSPVSPNMVMETVAMAAQSTAIQPEEFQRTLIAGMERALLLSLIHI